LIDNERINKTAEADLYPNRSWIVELSYGERLTIDETVTYSPAAFTVPVCQKRVQVITYLSAEYANSVCQKWEQEITYPSAEYASPVCQVIDDSISYVSAEFTNPVCQQTELFPIGIKLGINLKKNPRVLNSILITWQFSEDVEHFETTIRLHSVIQIQSGILIGIQEIEIKLDVIGTSGNVTQIVNNISSFVTDGTTLTYISPDNVNGRPIIVSIRSFFFTGNAYRMSKFKSVIDELKSNGHYICFLITGKDSPEFFHFT
jgi:hypothetical protein